MTAVTSPLYWSFWQENNTIHPVPTTVPTNRVRLTTVSHGLSWVQPRAQQGALPRPIPGLGLSLGLGRRSPPRPIPGLGLSLSLGRRSPPCPTPGLSLGRSHNLARPQPRPQEKSPPRPTSASDRLHYRGYIITLPLASCLRLWRNKTGVTSRLLRQQVMMVPCMHPWRQLFSALYEGKETSAGPRAAPPATLLQGSNTSPSATLAHSYTPICTARPSPCIYKRGCPGPSQGRLTQMAHFKAKPSPVKLVTPTTSTPVQDNISLIPLLCFILHQPIWAGTRNIKFTSRLRVLAGPKRRQHVNLNTFYLFNICLV
jgi:hypothetical protein